MGGSLLGCAKLPNHLDGAALAFQLVLAALLDLDVLLDHREVILRLAKRSGRGTCQPSNGRVLVSGHSVRDGALCRSTTQVVFRLP